MTYDDLMILVKGSENQDPLIDPDHPERASITDEGLVILGQNGDGDGSGTFCSDMRIVIEPNGFRAWMRDPEGSSGEDVFHGPDWMAEAFFEEYDSLVTWAYEW